MERSNRLSELREFRFVERVLEFIECVREVRHVGYDRRHARGCASTNKQEALLAGIGEDCHIAQRAGVLKFKVNIFLGSWIINVTVQDADAS